MSELKTSLGIWAFGPMVTRFVPGGYQPEHAGESTAVRAERAVEGLDGLIDDYEFHYPQELAEQNLDEVRAALDGHGIYAIATGTHLNPRYGKGALSSPDDAVRDADAVITMGCGDACPFYPGKRYLDWELPDPAGKTLAEVRPSRDEIDHRVRVLLDELVPTAG